MIDGLNVHPSTSWDYFICSDPANLSRFYPSLDRLLKKSFLGLIMLAEAVWSDLSSGSSGKFRNEWGPPFFGVLLGTLILGTYSNLLSVFCLKVWFDSRDFWDFRWIYSSSMSLFNSSISWSSFFSSVWIGNLMFTEPDFFAKRSLRDVVWFWLNLNLCFFAELSWLFGRILAVERALYTRLFVLSFFYSLLFEDKFRSI